MEKYSVILADCPWNYLNSHDKNGSVRSHYNTMTDKEICELPINNLAHKNSVLLLWGTWPKLKEACLPVIDAWGFEYVTGFPWIKVEEIRPSLFGGNKIKPTYGTGFWIRGCTEPIFIAKKGNPKIPDGDFVGLLGEAVVHSKKPNDIYEYAEAMPGPYLELFARKKRDGWDSVGFGIDGKDIKKSLNCLHNKL